MMDFQTNPKNSFNTIYDGYKAVIFDNTTEFNNFTLRLKRHGLSYRSKIIKGKRAGRKRREFVVMLVEPHGVDNGA